MCVAGGVDSVDEEGGLGCGCVCVVKGASRRTTPRLSSHDTRHTHMSTTKRRPSYWERVRDRRPDTLWIESPPNQRIFYEIAPNKPLFERYKRYDYCFSDIGDDNIVYYGCYSRDQDFPDVDDVLALWRREDANITKPKKFWRVYSVETVKSNEKSVILGLTRS